LQGDIYEWVINTLAFSDSSSAFHIVQWLDGLTAIGAHPLGLGLGMSGRVSIANDSNIGGENQLIITGVQIGVIAVILYVAIYIYTMRTCVKLFKSAQGKVRKPALALFRILYLPVVPQLAAHGYCRKYCNGTNACFFSCAQSRFDMKQENQLPNNNDHIAYIDGCRGLAILIVVLAHAGLGWIIPGKFGVTLFFFISGFLITKLLLLEIEKKGKISIGRFYLRRFFRLYPALLAMIIVSIITAAIIKCTIPNKDIFAALFYFTNYYIGWIRPVVPDCYRLLDIIWSLSVEEHFYFFFPFLTAVFLAGKKKKMTDAFGWLLLLLCLVAFLCRCWLFFHHQDDVLLAEGRIYFSTHTRMDSILWGCIASFFLFGKRYSFFIQLFSKRIFFYLGLLLLFLSVAVRFEVFRQTLLFTCQGLGLLLLVPALHFPAYTKARKIIESPFLLFIGRISYSLYLFHWGASKLANSLYEEHSLKWQLLFWPLAIGCTLLSYYGIEKPFVKLRRKFGSHATG
jgi:peptidoglycan/LPS O-acetylase OafA/YrhL